MNTKVTVTTQLGSQEIIAGYLYPSHRSAVFTYSSEYLEKTGAFALAPSLPLTAGPLPIQALGGFSDSAPDRWGRKILQRTAGRTSLGDYDYLLGVNDAGRQGATRFWANGKALAEDGSGVPVEVDLPHLLSTADAVEQNLKDIPDVQTRRLFRATGSLGGARPKANVSIGHELWLAKFPKPVGDEWDIMGWELTVRDLQEQSGISVAPGKSLMIHDDFGVARRVYLQRRFDRTEEGQRIPYISALTALEAQDGEGGDWVDLIEFAKENGSDVSELWKRLVFGYLVGNTDDHLRNHGFLRGPRRWQISPSFDVNPTPDGNRHELALLGNDEYQLEDILQQDILHLCSTKLDVARNWLESLRTTLSGVSRLAHSNGLDTYNIELMKPRFDGALEELSEII